jgi:type I site-specific restriction endonuclease
VLLTPEEWVRQHVLHYLHHEKGVPLGLMAVEQGIKLNGMQRRCDIVIYNTDGQPVMIVECKAPTVNITQDVFDQIARYNLVLKVGYLLVTNGIQHISSHINHDTSSYYFLPDIPDFATMNEIN